MNWKIPIVAATLIGVAAAAYFIPATRPRVLAAVKSVSSMVTGAHKEAEEKSVPPPPEGPWDGLITVDPKEAEAIGLTTQPVKPQTKDTELFLVGTTDYNQETQTLVRPRFDCLVNKVHATLGQRVHKGDPLVDLYSTALAEAKSAMEVAFTGWRHDKRLYDAREPLHKQKAISEQAWADIVNDEAKSKLDYKLSRDKLLVYGLTDEEIDAAPKEDGSKKAQMTLRSPADGVIVKRDVVPGNLYETTSVLMVISPLDKLWVLGNVNEGDAGKVKLHQKLEIEFPYLNWTVPGEVESIYNQIDPTTRAVRLRTSVPDPDDKLKAGMYVRIKLLIPFDPKHTVIPRVAMVADDSATFVFVRKSQNPDRFERRRVVVAQERDMQVFISSGLTPGEVIVSNGSLIMQQMYEDASTTTIATTPQKPLPARQSGPSSIGNGRQGIPVARPIPEGDQPSP